MLGGGSMAGIGFRIEKILEGDTYLDTIKAHFYSAVIFSGPWLLSILTLFCLGYFVPKNIGIQEIMYFRTSIVYIFAFSLIGIGFLHLSLTRYLSDKLYLKEKEAMVPVFNSAVLMVAVIQSLIAVVFLKQLDVDMELKFLSGSIYVAISIMWIVMIFLTALQDFHAIVLAFVAGSVVTVVSAWWWGLLWGLRGYFLGYLTGHLVIVIILSARIFTEFRTRRVFDWEFFPFLKRHKVLILIGIFYNLALWIDKIVFWLSPKAISVVGFLRSFPHYESAAFFAYLTIIPALSVFLIRVETDFYKKYRGYYAKIFEKGTFADIQQAKSEMTASLRSSLGFVVIFQGVISLLAVTFCAELSGVLRLQSVQIPIFRIAVVGAYLHSLLLIVTIIILYFDFQRLALGVMFLFFVTNAGLTYLTSFLEMSFAGYGYLAAALIALATAFYYLDFKLKHLEYSTFALQPVGIHREEEIA